MYPDLSYLGLLSWQKCRGLAQALQGARDSLLRLLSETWLLCRGASPAPMWTESVKFTPVPGFFAGGQRLQTPGLRLLM